MLTVEEKLFIIRKIDAWTSGKIGQHLNRARSTIRSFIERFIKSGKIQNKPSTGRPRLMTDRNLKKLLTFVKNNPKKTLMEFKQAVGLNISVKTLAVYLKRNGYNRYRMRKKPRMIEPIMKKRLIFARNMRRTSISQWFKVIFCDETSIEEEKKYTKFCWRKKRLHNLL